MTLTNEPKEDRNMLSAMVTQHAGRIMPLIGRDNFERFQNIAASALLSNPQLAQCDRTSLLQSIVSCAKDGLMPDGREAAIVVRKVKGQPTANYQPMVHGIIKRVVQSGGVTSLNALVIHKNDHFTYYVDEHGEHFEFRPNLDVDRGDMYAVLAYAKTRDGGTFVEVMSRSEVHAARAMSMSWNGNGQAYSPWARTPGEMWRKTAIRRLCKRLPVDYEVVSLVNQIDEDYSMAPVSRTKSLSVDDIIETPTTIEVEGVTEEVEFAE